MIQSFMILGLFTAVVVLLFLFVKYVVTPRTAKLLTTARQTIAFRLRPPVFGVDQVMRSLDPNAKVDARKLLEGIAGVLDVPVEMLGYSGTLQEMLSVETPRLGLKVFFADEIVESIKGRCSPLAWASLNKRYSLPQDTEQWWPAFLGLTLEQIIVGLYGHAADEVAGQTGSTPSRHSSSTNHHESTATSPESK